jgi:SpoVK/Ycf46/Vps4 family AAA+-type ATPase
MSDGRPEGVYVIATCNGVEKMPPEWVRAERWDTAPFFIDLPDLKLQEELLGFYCKEFGVVAPENINMEGWSGAEIKAVCRIAKMMEVEVPEAERFVIPISRTMGKEIDSLRKWSKNRCIPASMPITGKVSKSDRAIAL